MTIQSALSTMSVESLRALNAQVCEELKRRQTQRCVEASSDIHVGDVVEFRARGRTVQIVVEKVNVKTLNGHELGVNGFHSKWRVSPTMVSKVENDCLSLDQFRTKMGVS